MAQKPSTDWPRRTTPLVGNEDLLRQNPLGDSSDSTKEQRVPVDLISDYVLNQIDQIIVQNNLTSQSATNALSANQGYILNRNDIDSLSLASNILRVTLKSGTVLTVDLSSLAGGGVTVVDSLLSQSAVNALSANQGYILNRNDIQSLSLAGTVLTITKKDATTLTQDLSSLGGGGGSITKYNAGNGCWVTASGAGVVYTKATGVGNIAIPSGVEVLSFRIVGTSGDLNSGELTINLNYDAGVTYNQANATLYHPAITIQNRTQVINTDPFFQRPDDAGDSIDIFDEIFAVAGRVTTKITGLAGDFGIKGQL